MTKYERLASYLRALPEVALRHKMSLSEVERVLGFSLPESARRHRAWWSNSTVGHSQARGWLEAGWTVESVDTANDLVVFAREGTPPIPQGATPDRPAGGGSMDSGMTPTQFEAFARDIMSTVLDADLGKGRVGGVPKEFDFVSPDGTVVGDAKYFTMVRGKGLPPAKFSVIAEHVWLLEKTNAARKFLVFGNDRRVPEEWLQRYRHLVEGVEFYFLEEESEQPDRL